MKSRKVSEENARLVENLVAAVRNREPILKNPEGLTEDIMNAIRENPTGNNFDKTKKSGELPVIIILRRILAAASVCLFIVFGYEEFVVVDKISSLEKQSSVISQSSQYQAALNLKKVMTILTVNPEMINRYLGSNTKKINLGTLLKAAMFADVTGLTPDALNSLNRAGYNPPDQAIISLFNNFDSTLHTRQR